MNDIVETLMNHGIDVILVGFFQQNEDWNLENRIASKVYNKVLQKVANENSIYFADIYSFYENVKKTKNIVEDVTSDYMHHPSDWGHMLYYSEIVPAFNVDNKIKIDEFFIEK